jgi:hypothetical protein
MNGRMLHQSHSNRNIKTNLQQKLKWATITWIIWTMSAQNYWGDDFIHTTQQTSSFRMSSSGIEIHDHKWRSGIVHIFGVQELRNSTRVLVNMSQEKSGFEILEFRNTKYELLCKRWKNSGKISFRVQEYEETHFIHMMYKLFSPKFLPKF